MNDPTFRPPKISSADELQAAAERELKSFAETGAGTPTVVWGNVAAWLTHILDEDEKQAKAATEGPWKWEHVGPPHKYALVGGNGRLVVPSRTPDVWPSVHDGTFMERHNPAAVLADIAAKRAIIAQYVAFRDAPERMTDVRSDSWWRALDAVVRRLGSAYADRPGYDEDWRP